MSEYAHSVRTMIEGGRKAEIVWPYSEPMTRDEVIPGFKEGDEVTITDIDTDSQFPYEINGGEDRVTERVVRFSYCPCGSRKMYHDKEKEWFCPFCENG